MKIIANAFLAALVSASVSIKTTDAIILSKEDELGYSAPLEVTFQTDNELVDTSETLSMFEQAFIMSCNDSHKGKDKFRLNSAKVKKTKHSHGEVFAADKNGSLRATTADDDDRMDEYINQFWLYGNVSCQGCSSVLEEEEDSVDPKLVFYDMIEKKKQKKKDDPADHAKWEATLCDVLGQMGPYAGAKGCKITFQEAGKSHLA